MTSKDIIIISEIVKLGKDNKGMVITLENNNKYYCLTKELKTIILLFFVNYKKYNKCIFRIHENEIIDFGYSTIK